MQRARPSDEDVDGAPGAPIHLLTGCTAVGKTELSLAWAARHDAEIVSADALLFYRGMDIGTAKPTVEERRHVPHHLIDVCEPGERMDVKRYAALAREAVAGIEARGRRVLVVGGSGFYLGSFLAPASDDLPADPALRAELEGALAREGLDALVGRLAALNPGGLGPLDARNPRRVVRALERCLVSGKTLVELARDFAALPAPFPGRRLLVTELAREPDALRERIARRTRAMLEAGLVEEVRALRGRGLEGNPSAATAVGYRETLAWLRAPGGDVRELGERITTATWRLVRKQRTWFRHRLPPHRIVALPGEGAGLVERLFADG